MSLEKYPAPNINITLVMIEKKTVIQNPVPRKRRYFFLEDEYSDRYFVIPEVIPPLDIPSVIVEKLFNCPSKAIPAGPMTAATTFTLTSPVNILIRVETAFREETFTRSAENKCFILAITDLAYKLSSSHLVLIFRFIKLRQLSPIPQTESFKISM
jgi:hypothetical protein